MATGYKADIKHLYIYTPEMNNTKMKLRKHFLFNSSRKIKYLGINLTKEVKDLYSEKYKTSLKEIK